MYRHRIDWLSLVLGLITLAVGVLAISGDLGALFERSANWLSIGIGLAAVVVLASVRGGRRRSADVDAGCPSPDPASLRPGS